MNWTKEQIDAITKTGKNIVVSAGAGSGKTSVLTERIYEKVKKGSDIRRLLVLTFTNAAAYQMKEKIRKRLIEEKMFTAANNIDSAYITTFDSFSLSIVKKYAYKLNIEKDLGISDSLLILMEKKERITNKFKEYYENKNEEFLNFLRKYTSKDDAEIVDLVLDFTYKLDLIVDVDTYVANYEDNFFNIKHLNDLTNKYEVIVLNSLSDLKSDIEMMISLIEGDPSNAKLHDEYISFLESLDFVKTYEEVKNLFMARSFSSLKGKNIDERAKELKAKIKKDLDSFESTYLSYASKNEMIEYIEKTRNDAIFLIKLAKDINDDIFKYKKENAYYDFIDIAKMANILINEFEEVREEIKNSFDEILIDEYQDTSDIQEEFISKISNNNLYMVGDIKQSIYRFRNANLNIFKDKYDNYDGKKGIRISLNENFRSRSEVVEDINYLFDSIMTENHGEADYKNAHRMKFGQKKYANEGKLNQNFNLEIRKYSKSKEYAPEEIEAFEIAQDILDKINSNYMVYDKGIRKAGYGDFTILIDRANTFFTFKKIFEYFKIPLAIIGDDDLKEGYISRIILNIIKGIASTSKNELSYRHAVVSILRSFLFEKSDEEILLLANSDNEATMILKELHEKIDTMSNSDLFMMALDKFKVYEKLSKLGDVKNSMIQIEYIERLINGYSKIGKSLSETAKHLSDIFDSNFKVKYNVAENTDNKVKIMTIHKSKGLEFPICYYAMTATAFNQEEIKSNKGFSQKYGVFLPAFDEGYVSTIIKQMVVEDEKDKDLSEKVRLFYVALTRAKEKMIIITQSDEKKNKSKKEKSFKDMLASIDDLSRYQKLIDVDMLNITSDYKSLNKEKDFIGKGFERIDYKTKGKDFIPIVKKSISKELDEIMREDLRLNIELGLKFHSALEVLDFKDMRIDDLPVDDFIKKTLKEIFTHSIFKDIKKAKAYHEYEFYFTKENQDYHGIIDLLLEYNDHIDIIDYKLSDTSKKEYTRQLNIYRKYVQSVKDKKVNMYLLSILKKEIKKVNEDELL